MKEINLLNVLQEVPAKKKVILEKVKLFSLLLLVVYTLVVVGVFSFWIILRKKDEKITEGITTQEAKIRSLEEKETLHVFLKQRLSSLVPLFAEEKIDYAKVLGQLNYLLPEGVFFENIVFGEERELEIEGQASNAVILASLIESLLKETDDLAENISLTSASRREDGSYTFSLFLNVKT